MVVAKAPKPIGFTYDTDSPRVVQAASLTLGVLSYLRVRSITDLNSTMSSEVPNRALATKIESIRLTDQDRELLADDTIAQAMMYVRAKTNTKDRTQKSISIAACPECGQWSMAGSGSAGKCALTLGCRGKMIKAKQATRTSPESEPDAEG